MKTNIILLSVYLWLSALSSTGICSGYKLKTDTLIVKSESVIYASDDSVCSVSVKYPIINGMTNTKIEAKINTFMKIEFIDLPEWLSIDDCDHETGFTYRSDYNVRYNSQEFISIQQYVYEYSGGAHGNYAFYSFNFELTNGELITLADIIIPEMFSLFSEEAISTILQENSALSLIEVGLFEDTLTIQPEQDFYITPGYIVLQFDPYEIASYAMGEIEIKIPFHKIKDILKPDLPFSIEN